MGAKNICSKNNLTIHTIKIHILNYLLLLLFQYYLTIFFLNYKQLQMKKYK